MTDGLQLYEISLKDKIDEWYKTSRSGSRSSGRKCTRYGIRLCEPDKHASSVADESSLIVGNSLTRS